MVNDTKPLIERKFAALLSGGDKKIIDNHRSIPDRDYRGYKVRLMQCAWRDVLESLNICTKHVAEKTFHWIPGSKIVEEIREKYN
ncbi:hypothetical protein LH22_03225 [Pantoea rwandensis]|uniref:Uncharacterized protein n=1 Tax=Pantoea rwandensis TaxID=1076550 RepID=A0ABM5REX2_9GAMM|nr:hypothetical protein LH22_03225 [Pantoea rwandensis]HAU5565320.1 hypothetical protein [Serratia fonticola]